MKKFYGIDDTQQGLLSTLFMAATIIGSPIAGYFGDRYNRKMILFVGGIFWIGIMLATSFIPEDVGFFSIFFLRLNCFRSFGSFYFSAVSMASQIMLSTLVLLL